MSWEAFFQGWDEPVRVAVIGVLAYAALIVLLRASGNRTLSKMNAFDFVITVAFGSTLASILLSTDVSLVQGVTALAVLVALQFVVTWSSVRAGWVKRAVTGEPRVLFLHGEMQSDAMRRARVTRDEVRAAVRSSGELRMDRVACVVMETDGSFSVIPKAGGDGPESIEGSSLCGVRGVDEVGGAQNKPGGLA